MGQTIPLGSAVYIRYLDHVLFRSIQKAPENVAERETIGWLTQVNKELLCIQHDRIVESLKQASCTASGLVLLKSCILEIRALPLQNFPSMYACKSVSEHIKPSTEKIPGRTTTIEVIERPLQPFMFDRRSSLHKLPRIISYLRQFYQDGDYILHDDVVLAIEENCGSDSRTIRKHIRLLIRHGYLTPTSTKRSAIVEDRKFVSIRTKSGRTTREYIVDAGFKFYVFGPRAPRNYQQQLNPPTPPTRSDEGYSQNNMCVSRSGCKVAGSVSKSVGKASVEAIVEEKNEEEVVLHTHICTPTQKQAQLTPLEKTTLRISKEDDAHG